MKKKLTTLLAIMMIATIGFSQFEIKINPISALFNSIPISAEYVLTDNMGAELSVGYYYGGGYGGFNSKVLYKYYFSPNMGGDKFYVAPYFNYTNYGDEGYKYTAGGVGFSIGYKWVSDSGILLDFGFGAGKNFFGGITYPNDTSGLLDGVYSPINFLGKLAIGYRF